MRFRCFGCSVTVSTELPDDAMIRAVSYCAECIEAGKDQDQELVAERDALRAEVDRLRGVVESKHGGEPLALLDELDEARARIALLREALKPLAAAGQFRGLSDGIAYVGVECAGQARRALDATKDAP